jgi:PAP_fibrillin
MASRLAVCFWIALAQPVVGFGRAFGQLKVPNTSDLFRRFLDPQGDGGLAQRRKELKGLLQQECEKNNRQEIEDIIAELEQVTPTPDSAKSPLLQRKWLLTWTTEKEINLFIDWNLSGEIYQTIDGAVLENMIPFQKGGYLGVKGDLSAEANGVRTNFEFTEATLDLGRWGSFKIPPVGKGWFDTLYLDDQLRVDTNSRNDILICRPMDDSS